MVLCSPARYLSPIDGVRCTAGNIQREGLDCSRSVSLWTLFASLYLHSLFRRDLDIEFLDIETRKFGDVFREKNFRRGESLENLNFSREVL